MEHDGAADRPSWDYQPQRLQNGLHKLRRTKMGFFMDWSAPPYRPLWLECPVSEATTQGELRGKLGILERWSKPFDDDLERFSAAGDSLLGHQVSHSVSRLTTQTDHDVTWPQATPGRHAVLAYLYSTIVDVVIVSNGKITKQAV